MRYHPALTSRDVSNVIEAACHAYCMNVPLNMFLSIHWGLARIEVRPQIATGAFLKSVGDWLAQRGHGRFYIWTIEQPAEGRVHSHILLNVPFALWPSFRKERRHRQWLEAAGARPDFWRTNSVKVVKIEPLTGAKPTDEIADEIYNLARVVCYMAKGSDEDAAREFGVAREPQGIVWGKR
jgi:hypothetical protein